MENHQVTVTSFCLVLKPMDIFHTVTDSCPFITLRAITDNYMKSLFLQSVKGLLFLGHRGNNIVGFGPSDRWIARRWVFHILDCVV